MKCPTCNSSRFTESKEGKSCAKCGYTWKDPARFVEDDVLARDFKDEVRG